MSFYNLPLLTADGGISPVLDAQSFTMLAGGTIAVGDAVAFDLSQTAANRAAVVVEAPANAGALAIGIALAAAVAGQTVPVAISGYVTNADVETGVVAGQGVFVGTTAGRLAGLQNAATSTQAAFLSAPQTGTGAAQNIAHGLGVVPDLVFAIVDDLTPATTGAVAIVYGTHTSTNAIVTVTTGKLYRVVALRFATSTKQLGAGGNGAMGVAMTNEAANKCDVFLFGRIG
jgi:hypothetical protein